MRIAGATVNFPQSTHPGENQREASGENQFTKDGFGVEFTNAQLTLRLKGERKARDTQLYRQFQGVDKRGCTGRILTGQPIKVNSEWSAQRITAFNDGSEWTCLGSRHDRSDFHGRTPLKAVLSDLSSTKNSKNQ